MEVVNKRIEYLEKEVEQIKRELEKVDTKIDKTEKDIMREVEKNQQDIKLLLKEQEANNKEKNEKLFSSVERLTESQHQQTLMQKDIQNELKTTIKEFTTLTSDLKENDKWKTRTIAGFVVSLVLMILGTLWKMIVPAFIILPFF